MASRGLLLQRALALILVLVGVPLLLALPGFFQDTPILEGVVSPRTVIAPEQVRVADPETTERQRREAADAVQPVLVANTQAQREIVQRVEDAFAAVRAAREPGQDGEVPRPSDQVEALMERLDQLDGQGVDLLVSLSRAQLDVTEREALDIARTLAREEFTAEEIAAIADGTLQTELAVRTFPEGVAALVVDPLLRDALRPTVQVDDAATQQRREQAAEQIADVVVTYQRDNAIVRAGDIVTEVQIAALRQLALEGAAGQDEVVKTALLALLVVVSSALFLRTTRPLVLRSGSRALLLAVLLLLFTAILAAIQLVDIGGDARFLLIPAAAFTMLGTILFDTRVGALLIVPITALTAYVAPADGVAVPFVAMSGLACIPLVHRLAARGQLRRAAWQSTLAIVAVAGVCQVVFGDLGELVPALLAGLGNAVLVTVIVNGALPFLESVFGVLTATSLLDLADRNHPLLRELEQQALGSYNHSIIVSTLVERACRAVNADALLASVCALYHDIGKVAAAILLRREPVRHRQPPRRARQPQAERGDHQAPRHRRDGHGRGAPAPVRGGRRHRAPITGPRWSASSTARRCRRPTSTARPRRTRSTSAIPASSRSRASWRSSCWPTAASRPRAPRLSRTATCRARPSRRSCAR